jgi:predicted dehydrogenase
MSLRVGIVGFGMMGRTHYKCWRAIPGIKVAVVCDVNEQAFVALQPAGNIAEMAGVVEIEGVRLFRSLDDMLAAKAVDAVSIATPSDTHAELACKALRAGVHVLCEKPMSLDVASCDEMITAAAKAQRILMIAQCIRFWPEYAYVRDVVRDGRFGTVIAATFRRVGSKPSWDKDSWFADEKRSGGMLLDLHIHDTDYIRHVFGMPRAVCTHGIPDHMFTRYDYGDGPLVTAEASWAMTPAYGFEMSFAITLERAVIVMDPRRTPKFVVYPMEGKPFTPEIAPGDGYTNEIAHFIELIQKKGVTPIVPSEEARDTVRICLVEKEALKRHEKMPLGTATAKKRSAAKPARHEEEQRNISRKKAQKAQKRND